MAENKNSEPKNVIPKVDPKDLRTKYDSLAAYGRTVVTFRFTVLGFYLAAVGLILGSTPSLGKYILLCVITISLYIIELRNRFLKNELEAEATQIEKKWNYILDKKEKGYEVKPTTIFGFVIVEDETPEDDKPKTKYKFGEHLSFKITHSIALDLLYIFVFLYALINVFFHLLLLGL